MTYPAGKFLYVLMLGYTKGDIEQLEYQPGEKLGGFDKWVHRIIGNEGVPVKPLHIYYAKPGDVHDSLPNLDDCLGLILSGSPCDVTDIKKNGYTWAEPLIPFIRRAYLACIPMFGICFGHQIISHSLGGSVGYLPKIPAKNIPESQNSEIKIAESTSTPSSPVGNTPIPSTSTSTSTSTSAPCLPPRETIFETGTRAIYCIPAAAQCPVFRNTYVRAATDSDVREEYVRDEHALYEWYHQWRGQTGAETKTEVKVGDVDVAKDAEQKVSDEAVAAVGAVDPCFLAQTTHGQCVVTLPPIVGADKPPTAAPAKNATTHDVCPLASAIPAEDHPEISPEGTDLVQNPTPLCRMAPVVLAYNCVDPHHAVSYGNNAWSTQFHPEFPAIAMREYVKMQAPWINAQAHVLGVFSDNVARVTDTPLSAQLLVSFVNNVVKVVNGL